MYPENKTGRKYSKMPSLVTCRWFLLFLYFLKFLQAYVFFIIRKPLLRREDSFDKSFQYKQITNPSAKYLELYHVFCCDQDEFSGNVLMIKRERGTYNSVFFKTFYTSSEISKTGQFKHISSSQAESGRACISGIRIIS